MRALRVLLVLDAAVLFLLGALFVLVPHRVEAAFQFKDLPPGVTYILSLWGCGLATMGIGYCIASSDPVRHVVWVQIGIARGALECLVGIVYLSRGIVTFEQAGFGIVVAGLLAVGYALFYPRGVLDRPVPPGGPA